VLFEQLAGATADLPKLGGAVAKLRAVARGARGASPDGDHLKARDPRVYGEDLRGFLGGRAYSLKEIIIIAPAQECSRRDEHHGVLMGRYSCRDAPKRVGRA
jgi:hypothetical protein